MEVMCLMGLFPSEYEGEIVKNSIFGTQNAANKLQWGIVKGLDAQTGVRVRICNSLYIGSYPKRYRKVLIPTFKFAHCDGAKDINIGFLNLSVVKQISRYLGAKRQLEKWVEESIEEEKVLLVYALTTPFVQLASYMQKKYPDIKVCIVVPDLPEYMNVGAMQKGGVYYKVKRIEIAWLKWCSSHIRFFVLLTDAMKNWFEHDMKYTVMEGIAPVNEKTDLFTDREKTVIYAGGIKREYGVLELIEAFMRIELPDWKLVIYGNGADIYTAKEISKDDHRIIFMGMQPNSVVVEHQRRASLLVNPRKNEEFAKYSFPSKVLEYMSSGTPMLAYKLDGIPDEYDSHYYRIPEESGGFQEKLKQVLQLSEEERISMGSSAKKFVIQEKNPSIQTLKIIKMLSGE